MAANAESRNANVTLERAKARNTTSGLLRLSHGGRAYLSRLVFYAWMYFWGEDGCLALPKNQTEGSILSLVGFLNSGIGESLASSFTSAADAAARTYDSGVVASFPDTFPRFHLIRTCRTQ